MTHVWNLSIGYRFNKNYQHFATVAKRKEKGTNVGRTYILLVNLTFDNKFTAKLIVSRWQMNTFFWYANAMIIHLRLWFLQLAQLMNYGLFVAQTPNEPLLTMMSKWRCFREYASNSIYKTCSFIEGSISVLWSCRVKWNRVSKLENENEIMTF